MTAKNELKRVEVVAAIIKRDNEIFATQRGYGEFAGGWEFPGGKVEAGEANEQALKREIKEELDVNIIVGQWLHTVEYDYPTFHLTMHCYICEVETDDFVLKEHLSAKWLNKDTIDTVTWLPADIEVAEKVKELL